MATTKSVKVTNIIASSTLSSTSLIYSAPIDARYMDNIGIQMKWTGTPSGLIFLDTSANYVQDVTGQSTGYSTGNPSGNADWVPSSTPIASPAGTSGIVSVLVNQNAYPWLKLRYLPSSTVPSSGVLDVWVAQKQL